jgi:hypothetical protein
MLLLRLASDLDPPTSTSRVTGFISMYHHTWSSLCFLPAIWGELGRDREPGLGCWPTWVLIVPVASEFCDLGDLSGLLEIFLCKMVP